MTENLESVSSPPLDIFKTLHAHILKNCQKITCLVKMSADAQDSPRKLVYLMSHKAATPLNIQ